MNSLKSLATLAFTSAISSAFCAYGPCTVKKPHTAVVFSGDLLYWRPDQTAMTYSLSTNDPTLIFGPKNKEFHQGSDWGLGFRVGGGLNCANAHFDILSSWTQFHHTAHSTNSEEFIFGTQLLSPIPIFTVGGSGNGAGNAHSKWNLKLDLIDLTMAYQICFGKKYLLRPYLGVSGGWIYQKQTIRYHNFLDTNNTVYFDATIEQKNNFSGAGPKVGISGEYSFGYGFGVFANGAASFLCGKANNPATIKVPNDPLGFPIPKTKVSYNQTRIIPALQAQVGLTWGWNPAKCFRLDLAALYEVQYFWGTWRNQSSMVQNFYIADAGYGNLMLHGGTFELKLSF